MRLALVTSALLAVAASRGGCGGMQEQYDPCTGKACGAACTYDPPCRLSSPPCMVPSYAGQCDPTGACVPGTATCTSTGPCAGKKCGDACSLCGDVECMSPVRTVCDASGACVPWSSDLCYDPCAGKTCGDVCRLCPPDATTCAETACLKACDPSGRCLCAGLELRAACACTTSGGTVATWQCCSSAPPFPNTCLVGACGCSPAGSVPRQVCLCPAGQCFDGTRCVVQR